MTRYLPSEQSKSSEVEAWSATWAEVMMHGILSNTVLDFGKPA